MLRNEVWFPLLYDRVGMVSSSFPQWAFVAGSLPPGFLEKVFVSRFPAWGGEMETRNFEGVGSLYSGFVIPAVLFDFPLFHQLSGPFADRARLHIKQGS